MSRAFVKERDDEPVVPFEEVPTPHDVTAAGLRRMNDRLASASASERPALERRIASARVADVPVARDTVAFGATVTVRESSGKERVFTITGHDDVDIASGRVAADSPLAVALLGRRAGRSVVWHRPAGDERLTIVAIDYGELETPRSGGIA